MEIVIVEGDSTLTVVATASGVSEAIRKARLWQPQVAVLDVNMPDGGGWAAARGLREVCSGIRLVAYSSYDEALVTRTMSAAGICSFVSKGSDIQMLISAIHGADLKPAASVVAPLLRRTIAVTRS